MDPLWLALCSLLGVDDTSFTPRIIRISVSLKITFSMNLQKCALLFPPGRQTTSGFMEHKDVRGAPHTHVLWDCSLFLEVTLPQDLHWMFSVLEDGRNPWDMLVKSFSNGKNHSVPQVTFLSLARLKGGTAHTSRVSCQSKQPRDNFT